MTKIYSVWLPFKGEPSERGKSTTAFCSEACAKKAGVPAKRMRWAAGADDSGLCSRCGHAISEVPEWVLEREADEAEVKRMSKKKQERREPISAEIGGQVHRGTLIFRGSRKLSVTVEYEGQSATDSRSWEPGELHDARTIAKLLLIRLIDEAERKGGV